MFKPQKVLHLKDELKKKNPKLNGSYMITTKVDGWFVVIPFIKNLGWQTPLSSAMRKIPSLIWIVSLLNRLDRPKEDCYLIAEAIVPDLDFPTLNGLLNRTKGNCNCLDVQFQLHDIIIPSKPFLTALERWNLLQQFDVSNVKKHFVKLPLLEVSEFNLDAWKRRFDKEVNKGEEGIIFKQVDGIYHEGKRNSTLLKDKLKCEVDLLAVRLEEGVGEKGNDSLTLISKRDNGIEVRTVISKHKDKELFRSNPEEVIGKIVTVKAMEELEDGQLRQPVFRWVRHDKQVNEID
jgi:ATP-dependent DNA ligase